MYSIYKLSTSRAWFLISEITDRETRLTTNNPQISGSLRDNSNTTKLKHVFVPCNNPDNLIDEETAKLVASALHMTILPLVEIFGVTTNIINCMVFARQGLKDRINLCLFSLALADLSFLLLMFSSMFFHYLRLIDEDLGQYWSKWRLGTLLGPRTGSVNISNLLTMIISLERCICILAPFAAKKFLRTRYMAAVIVTMSIYILGIYSLQNLKNVTVHFTDPVTNTSRWVSRLSDFYRDNRVVIDILYNYLMSLTIPCLTLAVVIVATSLTVIRLRNRMAWRQESVHQKTSLGEQQGDKQTTAVTKMLLVVCLIYVVTTTPAVIQNFFRTLVSGYKPSEKFCNSFAVIQSLVLACRVLNSSVNCIVYFTMGSRFRHTLRELIGMGSRTERNTSRTKSLPSGSQNI